FIVKEEVLKEHFNEDIKYNEEIVNHCNIEITYTSDLLPKYKCPNNMEPYEYLKKLCIEGLKRIFNDKVQVIYQTRLKHELDIINKMGFCNYFLVVWDLIKYAKENNIYIGPGRGSAAGSLVSYLLNITTIDPIKYNLIFERFLNPERVTMPDIDIDMQDDKREDLIKYCIDKYGIKKVVPIIAFGTLASKQVIRDVGRTMDIDLNIVDYICKQLDSRLTLKENIETNKKLKDYIDYDEELKKLYEVASKFEGLKRHTTIHAAGIIMSEVDIDEIVPLDKSHNDFYTTAYDMNYLEELGLLKMDFLAIKNLTIIHDIIDDINSDLDFDNIPLNDKKTLDIFTNVDTLGIFQFESNGMMNFLRKFKPSSFEDIFAAIALYRPGPMDNIDTYIKRKEGKIKIDYYHELLVDILKPTYGILIYQEQIMQVAKELAGYNLGEADILRRAMSKKKEEILIKEKDKFINGCLKNNVPNDIANKVYELVLKFASYGFNRSHSVAYSMVAYKMAYLKAHYRIYFIKNLLNTFMSSDEKKKEYIYEARKNNINVVVPSINDSLYKFEIINNELVYPLTGIKGVGNNACNFIIEERKKEKFKDIYDFFKRGYNKAVNRKVIENLIYAGCFDCFDINRKTLINNLDELINYSEISGGFDEEFNLKPELTYYDEFSKKDLLAYELDVFGFYFTKHPITDYKNNNYVNLNELDLYFDKNIKTVIFVERLKEITTKKNDKMLFITGADEINSVDVVLFPKTYEKFSEVKVGDIIEIDAKVEKRFDKYQLVVNNVKNLY
ncbi:MAG TPA: DNA polymerase III subunit alpha, partial [Bacilli bacterium]|nr:DNA polymerase III subunit alpha [Bacilli bacterium]